MNTPNNTTQKLSGKVALVTGASKGIGAAIAKRLADDGAAVVVNYSRDKVGAEKTVAAIISAGGQAVAVQADLSVPTDSRTLIAATKAAFGKLDILVNNAGVYEFAPLEDLTVEDFRRQFDLNVLGLLLTTQAALPLFPATGGSIINISSYVSTLGLAGSSVYSATKGAVDALTRSLATEFGPKQIRVNAINPGMVETEGVHAAGFADSDLRRKIEAKTPLGRIGQPEDIAGLVAFLASEDASWITGESHRISGGQR